MFRFTIPRGGQTWALRVFPELVCAEGLRQAASSFAVGAEDVAEQQNASRVEDYEIERLRFTGRPRPGDVLLLKIRRPGSARDEARLEGEVWVHHRMVAQGALVPRNS